MNICAHLWEALLCQKVPCVPCVLWDEHRSLVGALETSAPPTEWLRQELKVAAWYGQDAHTSYFLLFYFFTLLLLKALWQRGMGKMPIPPTFYFFTFKSFGAAWYGQDAHTSYFLLFYL